MSSSGADQRVMDAMMDDLGNGRLEELATDNDGDRRRRRQTFQVDHQVADPPSEQRDEHPAANDLIASWKAAFDEGVFDDSDYNAVKALDSIDDGNTHRLNKGVNISRTEGSGGAVGRGNRSSAFASRGIIPKYDPLNPGYSRKPKQPVRPLQPGYRESPLGAVLPPGAEIKRWNSKQSGSTHLATTLNTPSSRPDTPRQTQIFPVERKAKDTLLPHKRLAGPITNEPCRGNETRAPSDDLVRMVTSKQDRALFLEEKASILLVFGLDLEFSLGQVSVYEIPQDGVTVWDLNVFGGKTLRGDIRLCLRPFQSGSTVHLRRQDSATSEVRSSHIRFGSIPVAQKFEQVISSCRAQNENSRSPIFNEVTETGSVSQPELATDNTVLEKIHEQAPKNQMPETSQSSAKPVVSEPPQRIPSPGVVNEDLIEFNSPESQKGSKSLGDLIDFTTNSRPSVGPAAITKFEKRQETPMVGLDPDTVFTTAQLEHDVETIETITAGVDISQDSLRMLSFLTARDYNHMAKARHSLEQYLTWAKFPSVASPAKRAAMQIATMQLRRYEVFKALERDERRKSIAVVYVNILHGNNRIVRSMDQMIILRQDARPCPQRVHDFNEFSLRLAGRPRAQQPSTSGQKPTPKPQKPPKPTQRRTSDEQPVSDSQPSLEEESLIEIEQHAEEGTTTQFIDLLKHLSKDNTNPIQAGADVSIYTISNSSASTIRPSVVPRTDLTRSEDTSSDCILMANGYNSYRSESHSRNTSTSHTDAESCPNSGDLSPATGDLSSLSGITGQFATLKLNDMQSI
ncbi:hypothetical protein F5Y11DRAFT_350297 [Daldinia sp. FL1419]|nr:hypothetical protein F5Y11DRAFT_350297 [Daldinia sp. FL1419]